MSIDHNNDQNNVLKNWLFTLAEALVVSSPSVT